MYTNVSNNKVDLIVFPKPRNFVVKNTVGNYQQLCIEIRAHVEEINRQYKQLADKIEKSKIIKKKN